MPSPGGGMRKDVRPGARSECRNVEGLTFYERGRCERDRSLRLRAFQLTSLQPLLLILSSQRFQTEGTLPRCTLFASLLSLVSTCLLLCLKQRLRTFSAASSSVTRRRRYSPTPTLTLSTSVLRFNHKYAPGLCAFVALIAYLAKQAHFVPGA